MELSQFEPEIGEVAESLEHAIDLASTKYATTVEVVTPTDIALHENGLVDVSPDLQELKMTSSGVKTLCKSLKIPDPFAGRIPFDLLQTNVQRLCMGSDGMRVVRRKDSGVVIGFLPSNKGVISNSGLLNQTIKGLTDDRYDDPTIRLSDSEMIVTLLSDVNVEPKVGDISRVGQVISNSSIGLNFPTSRLYTHRLECLNGAVMPKSMGSVRIRFGSDDDEENALLAFTRKVGRLSLQEASLKMRYLKMAQARCPEPLWVSSWGGVNRVTKDSETTDAIFVCSEERRNQIKGMAKLMKNLDTPAEEKIELVQDTCYDVFNQITSGAHQVVTTAEKHKIWLVGGKILDAINKPSLGVEMN